MSEIIVPPKKPKIGIFPNISNADYHGDKDTYSSSFIKKMDIPANGEYYLKAPPEYKDCYRIGTAIHTYLLEPELFDKQFFTGIKCAKRSADEKAEWASFFIDKGADGFAITQLKAADWYGEFQKQTGVSILTPDELQGIKDMAESVGKNPQAMKLLIGGESEQSIYWVDEETGLNLRVRPDFMNNKLSDLKSVQSAHPPFFAKKAYDLGYHISQAMYQDGAMQVTGEFKEFKFICVETKAPYLCATHAFNEESAEEGYKQYRNNIKTLANCLDSGVWPGIEDNDDLSLPGYAFKDDELGLVMDGMNI